MCYAVFVKHGILPHTTFGIVARCTLQLCLEMYFETDKNKTKIKKPKAGSNLLKCLQIKL
jgi:hypothetical protein